MGKALCMITLLLLAALSHVVSRRAPTVHDVTPMKTHPGDNEGQKLDAADRDRCAGLGEEECLMRRTLEAHLDYIYTQSRKHP